MRDLVRPSGLIARGIGLLELMLSLAIIAILLIMATRYYQSASNNNSVSNTVEMVNSLKAGVKSYLASNPSAQQYPDISKLTLGGYLPTNFGTKNPFGGGICINALAGTSCTSASPPLVGPQFAITVDGFPNGTVCYATYARLLPSFNSGESGTSGSCITSTSTVTYFTIVYNN